MPVMAKELILGKKRFFLLNLNAEKSLATCQKRSLFYIDCSKCVAGWGSASLEPPDSYRTLIIVCGRSLEVRD